MGRFRPQFFGKYRDRQIKLKYRTRGRWWRGGGLTSSRRTNFLGLLDFGLTLLYGLSGIRKLRRDAVALDPGLSRCVPIDRTRTPQRLTFARKRSPLLLVAARLWRLVIRRPHEEPIKKSNRRKEEGEDTQSVAAEIKDIDEDGHLKALVDFTIK